MWVLLALGVACSGTKPCAGAECSCEVDADCVIGCNPDTATMWGCDCTNGSPKARASAPTEENCGGLACVAVNCGSWTTYEARCALGRCVGVEVE